MAWKVPNGLGSPARPGPPSGACCAACGRPSLTLVTTQTRGDMLAAAIKAAMDDAGINAEQLAPVMGESVRTISRWRSGEAVPDVLQARPLANALGVDPSLFVDPPTPPTYPLATYRAGKPMTPSELAAAAAAHGTHDSAEGEERPRLAAVPPAKPPRKRPERTPR